MATYKLNGRTVTQEEWDAHTNPALLEEMLRLQSPPMSNTDREFLEGRCNGNQFESQPYVGDVYAGMAKDAGVDPKGKVYLSGLAAFPGDPRAWVSGRGDAQRVCEDRGWTCDGSVKVKGQEQPDVWSKYQVAPDLVQERAGKVLASGLARDAEEAVEKATQQLSPAGAF